jgi:hypothetical protein
MVIYSVRQRRWWNIRSVEIIYENATRTEYLTKLTQCPTHTVQQSSSNQHTIHEMPTAARTKPKEEEHYYIKYIILYHFTLFLC